MEVQLSEANRRLRAADAAQLTDKEQAQQQLAHVTVRRHLKRVSSILSAAC